MNYKIRAYIKIGDIAKQIDKLEEWIKDKKINKQAVGGALLQTEYDMRQMIDLQWIRIKVLQGLVDNSNPEIYGKDRIENMRGLLCDKCKNNINKDCIPCVEDYGSMTIYKTLTEIFQ